MTTSLTAPIRAAAAPPPIPAGEITAASSPGDWLYMQSFQMALTERNFKILDVLIELTQNMVEGELVQLAKLGRMDLTEQDAVELAARKTACLFAGCARLGAVLGNLDDAGEQAWPTTATMPDSRFSWSTTFWILPPLPRSWANRCSAI